MRRHTSRTAEGHGASPQAASAGHSTPNAGAALNTGAGGRGSREQAITGPAPAANVVGSGDDGGATSGGREASAASRAATVLGTGATHYAPADDSSASIGPAAECIICLTHPQTTIMFPCRHLCLCDECASTMASRNNVSANPRNDAPVDRKCPVCRKPVIVMFQLKVS
jgi:hypothetical protein